ncbi:MAG: endonuclease, partial [Oscillospiraceae bacterium]|nr:endonuclease [Oscillospiraceae bacterium]
SGQMVKYRFIMFHYMAVTGKRTWYIATVILGKEFVYRKLEWNDESISALIDSEEYFWNNHVLTKTIPSPDGSDACDEIIAEYFKKARKSSSIKLVGFDDKLNRRENILRQISKLQEEQKKIEQEIKLYMQDNEYAYSNDFNISWCNVDSVRLDTKRIKAEQPSIYSKYAKASHCRRFEVKEVANNGNKLNQTA